MYPVKLISMQQALLPAALLTKAIQAEVKSISSNNLYIVKKTSTESFLHQLFFGKQSVHFNPDTNTDMKWSDPNEFSSYE
jgi:hypothetical protein